MIRRCSYHYSLRLIKGITGIGDFVQIDWGHYVTQNAAYLILASMSLRGALATKQSQECPTIGIATPSARNDETEGNIRHLLRP